MNKPNYTTITPWRQEAILPDIREIDQTQSPAAQLRQATPSVLYLAERHGIPPSLAREIYEERGF